jgi:hypothetical protein
VVDRGLPVAGKPFEPPETPVHLAAESIVATCGSRGSRPHEDGTRSVELAQSEQPPGERDRGALAIPEPEHQIVPLLHIDSPFEQPRSHLAGATLCGRHLSDGGGDQGGIADQLGLLQRRPGVGQRGADVGLEDADPAAVAEDPREAGVVAGRLCQRLVQELDQRLRRRVEVQGKLEEQVGTFDPVRNLGQQLLHCLCSPHLVAREAVTSRRREAPAAYQCRIVGRELGGEVVQLGGSSGRAA